MTDIRPFHVGHGDTLEDVIEECRRIGAVKEEGGEEWFYVQIPARPDPAWMRKLPLGLCLDTKAI